MQPSKTEAIGRFLKACTHSDLASLYNHDMECQVNVAQEGGTRVDGEFKGRQWHGWTDGLVTWKSFRIPYKANTDAEYLDGPMTFDLERYVEGIGMTGWDWKAKVSRWVAFDFDAITGHSDKHARKLSEAELEDVATQLKTVPWCTLRRSTSGKGLHLYVFTPEITTDNHTEHAALARAILGQLSASTGFDFTSKVDIVGGNMWVWHRKMKGTDGLKLLKQGERLSEAPANWRDHIEVCKGGRKKTLPIFIQEQGGDINEADRWFQELSGQQTHVPLDEDHKKLINWLNEHKCGGWWDQDHHMLVTHTFHLKEAHTDLNLKGKFETVAKGTTAPGDHNCFCYPVRKGAWSIRRYSKGFQEYPSWEQDGQGWTRCFYNKEPDLKTAARVFEGKEHPSGGYQFRHAELAKQAAEAMGAKVNLPNWIMSREAKLKEHKDGRIVFEIKCEPTADLGTQGMEDWIAEKGLYKKVLEAKARDANEIDISVLDDMIRHIVTPGGEDCGWLMKSEGTWKAEPLAHVKAALMAMGFDNKEINQIIGTNVLKCWTLVNRPFQAEYPSGREWNRNAVQLRYRPSADVDNISCPTWNALLNQAGCNLDPAVQRNEWCRDNGILTGADYLKTWVASLFQFPLEPLPYLFFFGDTNTAKSSFHEALSLLVTHGVVRADQALTSTFNGELAGALVCVIEEIDLRKNKQAYNKMKDWVTARQISIRAMYEAPYLIPNSTHWIQTSNDFLSCPVLPGDSRIVYIQPPVFQPGQMIPKREFFPRLEKEAPDFLAEILKLEIPRSPDRLNIPCIATDEKNIAEEANEDMLSKFIRDNCFYVAGEFIKFSEFYDRFIGWMDVTERGEWSKIQVGRYLPPRHPRGRMLKYGGQHFVGNISWTGADPAAPTKPRLVRENPDILVEEKPVVQTIPIRSQGG